MHKYPKKCSWSLEPINKLAILYIQKVFTISLGKLALWIVKYFSFEAVLRSNSSQMLAF